MTDGPRESSGAVGRLADGTPYFAPLGEIPYDAVEDRVQCHLCGKWFRTIGGAHLIHRHGWTITEYREAFFLLRGAPTCARGTSAKLSTHTTARVRAGELPPPKRYRKPPGTGGRGVRRSRSLAALRPQLLDELDRELNPGVDPYRLGVRSGQRLWWRCARCGNRWQAATHERSNGTGCPTCARNKQRRLATRVRPERSLAVKRPDLIAELHPSLNGDLDPAAIGAGSGRKVWWRCSTCAHEWQADPASRARGRGCPACGRLRTRDTSRGHRRVPPERSLAKRRAALASELHPTRNGNLDATTIAAYANLPVWWLCPTCGNEWRQAPNSRCKPNRCPDCRADKGPHTRGSAPDIQLDVGNTA